MSSIFKTADLDSQYKKILKTQKELIRTNKYMRELEQKYNKSKKKYSNLYIHKKPSEEIPTHNWPIESGIFTKILQKKLDSELNPIHQNYFKLPSRVSLSKKKSVHSNLSTLKLNPLFHSKKHSTRLDKSLDDIISLTNKKPSLNQPSNSPNSKPSPNTSFESSPSPSLKQMPKPRLF